MALGAVDYKPKEWDRRPEQRVKDTGDLGRPNRGPLGDTTPNGTKQHLVRMITVHFRPPPTAPNLLAHDPDASGSNLDINRVKNI